MRTNVKTVDDYIASHSEAAAIFERVRSTIRKAVPEAEESISYGMPAYKLQGRPMLYFAAWKEHYSLYPATERLKAALKADLTKVEVDKNTIRLSYSLPAPVRLIAKVAKFRAQEIAEQAPRSRSKR